MLTAEDLALWAKYYGTDKYRADRPVDRPMDRSNKIFYALRCSGCAYIAGNPWVHIDWHETRPEWLNLKMLKERKKVMKNALNKLRGLA